MRVEFRCDPALVGLLPRPAPARGFLPEWLRTMPREAASAMHTAKVRTVKQCPPFVDAMSHGFVIPLPCDVTVRAGTLSWDWDIPTPAAGHHPRAPLSFHAPAQVTGTPFENPDRVVVKFNCFWTIALDPGWSLFATHPVNRDDLPFRTLGGLIDCDRFHDVGLLFPAVWIDPHFEGVLPRGTPVAQCIPVPRTPLELSYATIDPAAYDALADRLLGGPGVYRRGFRVNRSEGAGSGAGSERADQVVGTEPEPPDPG